MAGELASVLSQIRALDGFATFGQPPALSELLAEAAAGPIVTFNISRYRSDAVLLTGGGVTSLPLPGLAQDTLEAQVISFHEALRTAAEREASTSTRAAAQGTLHDILGWLWDTAAEPVLSALGYHRQPPPGAAWPRIWWAPGGRLSPLPIHAAGHHTAPPASGPARPTVMDRVISSYTPTIRALRYARQHLVSAPAGGPALIVAMPVTPGLTDGALPHVTAEAARVRATCRAPSSSPNLPGRPAPATRCRLARTSSRTCPVPRSRISPATAPATSQTPRGACCCCTTTTATR
jgi:hypothetical protein